MKRTVLIALALASAVAAQTLPAHWYGMGAAWNGYSRPQVNGWMSYAFLISEKGQIYSISTTDVRSARTRPFSVQTSTRTGLAAVVRQAGPVAILGFGDAGVAAAESNAGGAFSGGGVVIVRLGSSNWTVAGAIRHLKTAISPEAQTAWELGFGRIF